MTTRFAALLALSACANDFVLQGSGSSPAPSAPAAGDPADPADDPPADPADDVTTTQEVDAPPPVAGDCDGSWRLDRSGYPSVPNPVHGSVSDITETCATPEPIADEADGYHLTLVGAPQDEVVELAFLADLEPAEYDLSGDDIQLHLRLGSSPTPYSTAGEPDGSGTLTITGNDGTWVDGTFEVYVCWEDNPPGTPSGFNCYAIHDGAFHVPVP